MVINRNKYKKVLCACQLLEGLNYTKEWGF